MTENERQPDNGFDRKTTWVALVIGALVGAALCGLIIFTAMPVVMLKTHESPLGFDETVAALEEAIPAQGWVVSAVMDLNKSMAKHGVEFGPRVTVVKLCKPQYAKDVLTTDRNVSALMPCSFAVWEDDGGRVQISKMNMRLMAKMFGGNVAKVMGTNVAADEQAILAKIMRK